jgi:hypothetical protein
LALMSKASPASSVCLSITSVLSRVMASTLACLRPDLAKAGVPEESLESAGLAKTVTAVDDGPEVPFRNTTQLPRERNLLVGTPGAHPQSATAASARCISRAAAARSGKNWSPC